MAGSGCNRNTSQIKFVTVEIKFHKVTKKSSNDI